MFNLRRTTLGALGFVVSLALVACGAPNVTPTLTAPAAVVDTSAQDFTTDEAAKALQLNTSGELESAELGDIEAAVGRKATEVAPAAAVSADFFGGFSSVDHKTQIGYVRTTEDGRFLLSLKGNTKTYELTGSDGKRDNRISGMVNHKVILRGIMLPSGKLMVQHILTIPSFNLITDLFTKGRLAGTVFLSANRQGLVGAVVTLKQAGTGYVWRTQTDRGGNFGFKGLEPGGYSVTVGLGGFAAVTMDNLTVLKGKKFNVPVAMNAK